MNTTEKQDREWIVDRWRGLYAEGWGSNIVPDAFSHPAKFRPALIRHIYDHMIAEGWLEPGDSVLDPFGGVALGGLHAMHNRLHFVGIELEQRFVDVGAGVDCTGISTDDWVRFYGRWSRAARLEGRAWCPRCLAEAAKITEKQGDPVLLPGPPSASYRRNSGQIPSTLPHHYTGNLDLWRAMRLSGTAVLLQGDSRQLLEVLRGEVEGCVSSPPYANSVNAKGHGIDWSKVGPQTGNRKRGEDCPHGKRLRDQLSYGQDPHPAQLGAMPEGEFSAAVSSPPYEGSISHDAGGSHKETWTNEYGGGDVPPRCYGDNPSNLGNLTGGFEAAVSSPPFGAAETRDRSPYQGGYIGDMMGRAYTQSRQGETDGNLGGMETGAQDFEAVVSSPPFEDAVGSDDPDKRGGLYRDPKRSGDTNLTATYGDTAGQLGAMRGGFEASVSSPPYEGSLDRGTVDPAERRRLARSLGISNAEYVSPIDMENVGQRSQPDYGETSGQLGQERPDTFWSAARTIVEQVYAALVPGGHAVWVTKAFVRNGERVDFPGQWRQLCEAVGFVTLHEHHAMLVEDGGTQLGFFEDDHLITERKSFFRRLAESKGSPRIDWETVWCMEKPKVTL